MIVLAIRAVLCSTSTLLLILTVSVQVYETVNHETIRLGFCFSSCFFVFSFSDGRHLPRWYVLNYRPSESHGCAAAAGLDLAAGEHFIWRREWIVRATFLQW